MNDTRLFHSGTSFDGAKVLGPGSAVAGRDGRVIAVGTESRVRAILPNSDHDIALGDGALTPGFTDAPVRTVTGGVEPLSREEAITPLEAMRAYTQGSAWINRDHKGGRHRPGSRADMVLLDSDPFTLSPEDLHAVGVELTLAAGRAAYERADASA